MLETLIITLREGLEAFLICAVTLAYLAKTNRPQLRSAVFAGLGFAVLASFGVAIFIGDLFEAHDKLAEGVLSLAAGVLVFTLAIHMLRVGRHMKRIIEEKLEGAAQKAGRWAYWGVFSFISLLVLREGVEIVLLLMALASQTSAQSLWIGAISGIALSIIIVLGWNRFFHHINMALFLKSTALFLALFSVHLVAYGLHELVEAGVVNLGIANEFFEAYSPKRNPFVQAFNISIIAIPLLWMGWGMMQERKVGHA